MSLHRTLRHPLLLALVLALAASAACRIPDDEEIETSQEVVVAAEPARQGSIRPSLTATGVVRPAPGGELVVIAPQPARVAEVGAAVGDRVDAGTLLVRFEIPELEAAASAADAAVESAAARVENAQLESEREEGLFARGIAAKKEAEDARRELRDAEAELAAARAAAAAAHTELGRASVRAPFDGLVVGRFHNPGDLVEASSADPVLRLVDPRRLQVEVAVPAAQADAAAVDAPAQVLVPSRGSPVESRVVAGPGAVDPATGAATVRLSLPEDAGLAVGTPVGVSIDGEIHDDAVLVPSVAVVHEGPEDFVFTLGEDDRAHRLPVVVGVSRDGDTEILSGIAAGEPVLVRGQSGLPDGATVRSSP